MKQFLKKLAALVVALTLVATLVVSAGAEDGSDYKLIDKDKGSLTIYKYATVSGTPTSNSTEVPPTTNGVGTGYDDDEQNVTGYTPLNGAEFEIYRILDTTGLINYYNGQDSSSYTVEGCYENGQVKTAYQNPKVTVTTAGNGVATKELDVGLYLVVEVTAPDQITAPLCAPFLVSIPMVNASGDENNHGSWNYDVKVYPKNHEARGNLTVKKYDDKGSPLAGVTFKLEKQTAAPTAENPNGTWVDVETYLNDDGTTGPLDSNNQPTKYATKTDGTGELTFNNLPAGLSGTKYRLSEVSAPAGYIVDKTPIEFTVKTNNTIEINWNNAKNNSSLILPDAENAKASKLETNQLTLALKNPKASMTKNITDTSKTNDDYQFDADIPYTLTVELPFNVTSLKTVSITDLPSVGLEIDSDSVMVMNITDSDHPVALVKDTKYTVTPTSVVTGSANPKDDHGKGVTIAFKPEELTGVTKVEVTYNAHFTSSAVINAQGNENIATLTYSNEIRTDNVEPKTTTITDEAVVFTYAHQIVKYKDEKTTGNEIADVEFLLYADAEGQNQIPVKLVDGVYYVAQGTDKQANAATVMKTNNQGIIVIKGLDAAPYYLKETKTIAGYNLLSGLVEFTVAPGRTTNFTTDDVFKTGTDGKVTKVVKKDPVTTYTVQEIVNNDGMKSSAIINKQGTVLPQTGSMGYLLFCSAGLVLVIAGAMLILSDRKRKIR